MNIKTGIFTYFFLTIWTIGFGMGFISLYSNNGIIRIFGNLTKSNYLNSLPFLIIGILAIGLFFSNLIYSYWVKEYKEKLIIRNIFKREVIEWTEISEINKFRWINLPQFSIIKTKSERKFYVHCNYDGLKNVLHQHN